MYGLFKGLSSRLQSWITSLLTAWRRKSVQDSVCLQLLLLLLFQSASQLPYGKALYTYEGKEPGDLKFNKGDIIILRRKVDENWYHGELNGNHGFFPASYIQCIKPLPQAPPQGKALYDFEIKDKDQDKDCLTFTKNDELELRKGEMYRVIEKCQDGWFKGTSLRSGMSGVFPGNYVTPGPERPTATVSPLRTPSSPSRLPAATVRPHPAVSPQHSLQPPAPGLPGARPLIPLTSAAAAITPYRVVVPYPPQSEAEIELKEGDIVFVHKKREDGWYKGTLQRNGRTGLFPGSFDAPVDCT
uniref:RING-type E3 ubiquitin transferase n=1 Tax=Nothoprocta perdicaria TaxID=30464 RepID=A0A8C7ED32_NOTPE